MGPTVARRMIATCLLLTLTSFIPSHAQETYSGIPSTWDGLDELVSRDPELGFLFEGSDLSLSRDPGQDDFWVAFGSSGTSGFISAVDTYLGDLVVGGTFIRSGEIISNGIASWNGSEWAGFGEGFTESGPGSYAGPRDFVVSGDSLFVIGRFSEVDGISARNVCLYDGTSWRSLGPGLEGNPSTICESEGQVYVGGSYFQGENVARWNGSEWEDIGSGFIGNEIVFAITVYQGRVLACGTFDNGIAEWTGSGWLPFEGFTTSGTVYELEAVGDSLLVGGFFADAAGFEDVNSVALFDGSVWTPLGDGIRYSDGYGLIADVVFHDGQFVVSGAMDLDGESAPTLTWNGNDWVRFADGKIGGYGNAYPSKLHSHEGSLYAGGYFMEASGALASCIAFSDGGPWQSLGEGGLGTGDQVSDLALHNGEIIVAGSMTVSGSVPTSGIARWDGSGWSSLGTGLNGSAFAAISVGETDPILYVGGEFTLAGGMESPAVASWTADGGWSPIGGLTGSVYDLVEWDGQIVVGGLFSVVDQPSISNLAAWDGSAWTPVGNVGPDDTVHALEVHDGKLYAGGDFLSVAGTEAKRIASWDGADWTSLGQGTSSSVRTLLSYQGDLIVGGFFEEAGGQTVSGVARWDGSGWFSIGEGFRDGYVVSLQEYRGRLVAGGVFPASSSDTGNRTAASWDGESWQPLGAATNGVIYALLELDPGFGADPEFFVGGRFSRVGADQIGANLAIYTEPSLPDPEPDANTLLLTHFDGNAFGEDFETPVESSGLNYETGVFGRAVEIGSASRLRYLSSDNIQSDTGTVEFWIRPEWSGNDSQNHTALEWGGTGGIFLGKSDGNVLQAVVNRFGSDPNGQRAVAFSTESWQAGEWHHCAITWDSSELRLYTDGVLRDEEAVGYGLPSIFSSTFWVGRESAGNAIEARLDELRVSDIVRTPEEIEESYLRGLVDVAGACCVPTGSCVRITLDECDAAGGDFLGDGTVCDTDPCFDRIGACCFQNGNCSVQTAETCISDGGGFQGNGTECTPSPCSDNSNGVLFVHALPGVLYSSGFDYCSLGDPLAECDSAVVSVEGTGGSHVFFVMAALVDALKGITFGVDYDPTLLGLDDYGTCGEFEVAETSWPSPNSGVAVTWADPQPPSWQENRIVEVYWFAAYHYGPDATSFDLVAHPTQGAFMADDSEPAILNPIQCLGSLGFGMDGRSCCGDGVDIIPPTITFVSGPEPGGYSLVSEVEICWIGSDNRTAEEDLLYSYQLGNDPPTSFTSETCANYDLGVGTYTFRVTARDLVGNERTKELAFSVDLDAPDTQFASGPPEGGWWNSRTVSFSWTGSDDLSPAGALEFSHRFDGGDWSEFASATSESFPDVPDGTHTFEVRARDSAGRVDESPATRSFQVGLIDLVPLDFIAPDSAFVDRSMPVDWTVRNDGSAPAFRPWTDRIRLLDAPGGNLVASLGSFDAPTDLEPDSSYQRSIDAQIPILTEGQYWAELFTDSGEGVLEEEAEGNNAFTTGPLTLIFPPHPDLVVDSVSVPEEGVAGESFEVRWSVSNNGDAEAAGTWSDRVYASPDSVFGNGDDLPLGSTTVTLLLEPGLHYERNGTFSLPNTPGPYYILVVADEGDAIEEYDRDGNNVTVSPDVITVAPRPYPNLRVTVGDPDSISVVSGTSITFSYTVVNDGTAPTAQGTWQDVVYLFNVPSVDEFEDAGCFSGLNRIGTFANQRYLPVGDQYTQSVEVPIPDDTEGTFFLAVYTDYLPTDCRNCGWGLACVVRELDETDNGDVSTGFQIELSPQPDLVVPDASISFIPSAASGRLFEMAWADSNAGAGPTDVGSWRDYVYLGDDEVPEVNGNDVYLGYFQREGQVLSGGDDDTSPALAKQLPIDFTGDFYVKVRTDAQNVVSEFGREGNNISVSMDSVDVALSPPPNLVPISITPPDSALAGHLTTVGWDVDEITGAEILVASTWDDYAYLSLDDEIGSEDFYLGKVRHSTSGEFGSYRLDPYSKTGTFRIPDSVPEDDYRIVLRVDGNDGLFEGFDEDPAENDNVIASLPFPVNVRASDLLVEIEFGTGFELPDSAAAGQTINVSWKVTNVGEVTTPVSQWWDRVYFSANGTIGSGDDLLANVQRNGSLDPGESYLIEKTVSIPLRAPGPHYLIFSTDHLDNVFERGDGNENNRQAAQIEVTGEVADLIVESIEAPDIGESAQTVRIDWIVRNQGTRFTTTGSWIDRVYLSRSTVLTSESIPIGARTRTASLAADSSYALGGDFQIPFGIAGLFHVLVVTDADGRVFESNNGNNSLERPMTIEIDPAPLANLDIEVDGAPSSVISGQSIVIDWTVENIGPGPTNTSVWDDALYLSRDQFLDPGNDLFIGERRHTGVLPPGGQYTESRQFDVPLGTSGPYFVIAKTNYRSSVVEERTDDNVHVYPNLVDVIVPEPSDLVIRRVATPTEPLRLGRTVSLEWIAENQGENPVLGRWFDTVFLSGDPNWSIDDIAIGTFDSGTSGQALAPGDSVAIVVDGTVPALLPGNYYLIVRGDSRNSIPEADESNNLSVSDDPASVNTVQLAFSELPYLDEGVQLYEDRYYQIEVDEEATIEFAVEAVEGSQSGDWLQIFVRRDAVPSPGEFDFSATEADRVRQVIRVPSTVPGSYFVLARKVRGPGLSTFEVSGTVIPFAITAAEPQTVGAADVTLRIEGSRWTGETTFLLRHLGSGQEFFPAGIFLENEIEGRLVFDLAGVALGDYELEVRDGEEVDLLDSPIVVVVPDEIVSTVDASLGAPIRKGTTGAATALLRNESNRDIPFAVVMTAVAPDSFLTQWVPNFADTTGTDPSLLQVRQVLLQNLPAEDEFAIPVRARVLRDFEGDDFTFGYNAITFGALDFRSEVLDHYVEDLRIRILTDAESPGALVDLALSGDWQTESELSFDSLFATVGFQDPLPFCEVPAAVVAETVARVGITEATDYVEGLRRGACASFCDWFPESAVCEFYCSLGPEGGGEECGSGDPVLERGDFACRGGGCQQQWPAPSADDPNEKGSRSGYGAENWVAGLQPIDYRIYFENIAEASAPAARVEITDELGPGFNPGSFRLSALKIGDREFSLPDRSFYQENLDLVEEQGVLVEVTATLDVSTDPPVARWVFLSIDPETGEPPTDGQRGFLPPNVSSPEGEGYVEFRIGSTTQNSGSILENTARIIFDDNQPVDTNLLQFTLDYDIPVTEVMTLPDTTDAITFPVTWTVDDSTGGSGIASYSLYVSKNDGPFELYRSGLGHPATTFTGEPGARYGFFSRGIDNAGNEEPLRNAPDVVTVVGSQTEVWPGDADNNGFVDQTDLLALGQYFGLTGPPREDPTLEWVGQPAILWETDAATYVDGTGDGQIDQNDILPIGLNFGETHAASGRPESEMVAAAHTVQVPPLGIGEQFEIAIQPPHDWDRTSMGIGFRVDYPEEFCAVDSAWAGPAIDDGDLLSFRRDADGSLAAAFSRRRWSSEDRIPGGLNLAILRFRVTKTMEAVRSITIRDVAISDPVAIVRSPEIVIDSPLSEPMTFLVLPAYPNPLRYQSMLRLALPSEREVSVDVFDVSGRRVLRPMPRRRLEAGWHVVPIDASSLANGIYFYRVDAGPDRDADKIVVLR